MNVSSQGYVSECFAVRCVEHSEGAFVTVVDGVLSVIPLCVKHGARARSGEPVEVVK